MTWNLQFGDCDSRNSTNLGKMILASPLWPEIPQATRFNFVLGTINKSGWILLDNQDDFVFNQDHDAYIENFVHVIPISEQLTISRKYLLQSCIKSRIHKEILLLVSEAEKCKVLTFKFVSAYPYRQLFTFGHDKDSRACKIFIKTIQQAWNICLEIFINLNY